MAASVSLICNNCNSIICGKDILMCSNICSSDIPIFSWAHLKHQETVLHYTYLWLNAMLYAYYSFCVCLQELSLLRNISFKMSISCLSFIIGSNQFDALSVNINANIFLNLSTVVALPYLISNATYFSKAAQWFLYTLGLVPQKWCCDNILHLSGDIC